MKQPHILIVITDHQRADTVCPEHPAPMPHAVKLARAENDAMIDPYITVGLAPIGPGG